MFKFRLWTIPCVASLVLHICILLTQSSMDSPTIDEPVHLGNGLSVILHREFAYMDAPNLPDTLSAIPASYTIGGEAWRKSSWLWVNEGRHFPGESIAYVVTAFRHARYASSLFSIIGAITCFCWARETYGINSGIAALILWCFSPNMLGHGHLVTCDVPSAALTCLSSYLFLRWAKRPSILRAATMGLVIGCALMTKYVTVILIPILAIAFFLLRRPSLQVTRTIGQLLVAGLTALAIVNAASGFELIGHPLGELLPSRQLPSILRELPSPVSGHYLRGIFKMERILQSDYRSYMGGKWQQGGWSVYYLYCAAVKVPVGLMILLGLSLVGSSHRCQSSEVLLGLSLVITFAFVSLATAGISHHGRYAIPCLPFVFILASKPLQAVSGRNARTAAVFAAVVWTVTSSLFCVPHSISYFNELSGGPLKGADHLLDSNLDWGQDLYHMKRWIDENPTELPLRIVYFGPVSPSALGIPFDHRIERGGRCFVSINFLRGLSFVSSDGSGSWVGLDHHFLDRLSDAQPVARIGYSILVYDIPTRSADEL